MAIEVNIRKWGNSMGIILPKEIIKKEGLKENEKILIDIFKEADLSKMFGTLKRKLSGQEFKDMVREGWGI
ncbi:MAG: AbrB/MazE/SpoVT family DNA-binding domain-containing protein [Candidatus Nanoarchaeia archaeon]|nr:AbrB/MazE/SpoVT family DNA-binding domain-containing protein [Candidatus Nanoarchaeia archaeon]MDD5587651.1 AbrB/MazE/SpoVT family DNA-binding domain-containing protein [Candidatus Nanoarchaeia archaeon]